MIVRGEELTDETVAIGTDWLAGEAFDDAAAEEFKDAIGTCLRGLPKHHRCAAVVKELTAAFQMGMATMYAVIEARRRAEEDGRG